MWATGQSFTLVCCSDAYYSLNITNFYFSNGYDFLCNTFHQITDKCRLTRRCKWSGGESSLTIATVTMEDGTQWKVNCKYLCPVCTKVSAVFHCSDGNLFFAFWFIWGRCEFPTLNTEHALRLDSPGRLPMKTWWCKVETPCVSICKRSILCMYMYA